jgi:hypothetical protein
LQLRHAAKVLILAAALAACGAQARRRAASTARAQRRAGGARRVKAGIVVPAGGTLRLTVPPEARSLIALSHGEDPNAVTLSACHGRYPSAFFPGHFRVRRPLCDVPLDWRYGRERGRLRLSFGRVCG